MLSSGGRFVGSGVRLWPRRRTIIAATAALVLLPIEVSDAGWLPDFLSGSSKPGTATKSRAAKPGKSPTHANARKPTALAKRAAASKPNAARLAALGPVDLSPSTLKLGATRCDPARFKIVLDVGHTAESGGAISARNIDEFVFNLRLAKRIEEQLKAEGFAETRLLVTEGKARPSLLKRVAAAHNLHADLLLSIHHDSVPDKLLEDWEFEGKKSHFSDRFSGHSVFVSHDNPNFKTSFSFAELIGKKMKASGLQYAAQYTQPIMGRYRHPLLDKDTGVYSYDELVVLRKSRMPAVLLEAGSIINRDEELRMDSPERRDMISIAVAAAAKDFCDPQVALLGPP